MHSPSPSPSSPSPHTHQQQIPPQQVASLQRATRTAWQDIYYFKNQWQELDTDGLRVANLIVNTGLKGREKSTKSAFSPHPSPTSLPPPPDDLTTPLRELHSIVDRLQHLLTKMQTVLLRVSALVDDTIDNVGEKAAEMAVFRISSLEGHLGLMRRLTDMYALETSLKARIANFITSSHDITIHNTTGSAGDSDTHPRLPPPHEPHHRAHGMFLLSAWLHQPYIETEVVEEIEGVVREVEGIAVGGEV